jgi:cysteine desulfuration protein SufE
MQRTPSFDEIAETFALFDEWEGRYVYLIDLGKTLPTLDAAHKIDANLVKGCTSRVWMVSRIENDILYFDADSDAHIVKGLVALLHILFNGKALADVRSLDVEKIFDDLGLSQNLSPNRRSGFFAMVERLKSVSRG